MYKSRFRKWGLDKKHKAPEVLTMLRIKRERDAVGKKSKFFVRHRPVDWNDVQRYVKRSRLLAKLDSGSLTIGNADGIICRTPSPDPAATLSVPNILEAADDLRLADEAVRLMRDYCQGGFESHLWSFDATDMTFSGTIAAQNLLILWSDRMDRALECIAQSRIKDGFGLINSCLSQLSVILTDQDMCLIFYLLTVVDQFPPHLDDLRKSITNHVALMLAKTLGQRHPLSLLWTKLFRAIDRVRVLQLATRLFLDFFQAQTRHTISASRYVLEFYCDLLCHNRHWAELEVLLESLENLFHAASVLLREKTRILDVAGYTFEHLQGIEDNSAMDLIQRYMPRWLRIASQCMEAAQLLSDWGILPWGFTRIYRVAEQFEEARKISEKYWGYCVEIFGEEHDETIVALSDLVKDMRLVGHEDEAREMQRMYEERRDALIKREVEELRADNEMLEDHFETGSIVDTST